MNLRTTVIGAAAVICLSLSSQAATSVLSYNFDTTIPNYKYGYVYSETGSGSQDNGIFSPTAGNGGTGGLVATFNTTAMSGGWAGIGLGWGDWAGAGNYAILANVNSLADISLTLDAKAGGLTGTSAPVTFELKFEAPDNTIVPNDPDTDNDALLKLTLSKTLTSNWQTFTSSLDTWTITGGSLAQLKTYVGAMKNINFNVAYDAGGTLAAFGNDAGNTLSVDNVSVTANVVPEPSTPALLGLVGGLALVLRRRR